MRGGDPVYSVEIVASGEEKLMDTHFKMPQPGDVTTQGGWPTFTVRCKGGNDEVGGHGWTIGTQAASVPTFANPRRRVP
jgi:hypothetical protein